MNNSTSFETDRLFLEPLSVNDKFFIYELVNTKGWIQFIGDKNITTVDDAVLYIQKIIDNVNVTYWVVKLKENHESIGVVTFIKREYLDNHDIGFAFLPSFSNMGYAYEAVKKVMLEVIQLFSCKLIYATTIPDNINSIKLLTKLGFSYLKEIYEENETLNVFAISTEVAE